MGTLLAALGLMLVIEGLLPFMSPVAWRNIFVRVVAMRDGQIRFYGLVSLTLGLALLLLVSGF